jgi:PqqD family protein of HPr-rel-A system
MKDHETPAYTARTGDFCWEEWEERYVLFHRSSQKTHYLNQTSALVLQHLIESPHSVETLADSLAEESGEPTSDELRSNISRLLRRLETQGLAMRAQITDPEPGP